MPDIVPGPVGDFLEGTANAVKDGVSLAQDPFGFTATKMAEANRALAKQVFPELLKVTHPDYSMSWFTRAYAVSWAGGVILMCFVLLWNFGLMGRRRASGRQVVDSLTSGAPLFLMGAAFGPMLATLVLDATGALTDAMALWAGTSTADVLTHLVSTVDESAKAEIIGGSIVAIACQVAFFIAFFLILVTLLVLLVSQYLLGVIWPLAAVWWSSLRRRGIANTALMMWLTLALCPPLLFFLLGVGEAMIGGMGTSWSGGPLKVLANVVVAVVVLIMVGSSPWMLLRLAPVGLGATPDGMSLTTRDRAGAGAPGPRGHRGDPGLSSSDTHSGTAALSSQRADQASSSSEVGTDGPGDEAGGLVQAARARREQREPGSPSGTATMSSNRPAPSTTSGGAASADEPSDSTPDHADTPDGSTDDEQATTDAAPDDGPATGESEGTDGPAGQSTDGTAQDGGTVEAPKSLGSGSSSGGGSSVAGGGSSSVVPADGPVSVGGASTASASPALESSPSGDLAAESAGDGGPLPAGDAPAEQAVPAGDMDAAQDASASDRGAEGAPSATGGEGSSPVSTASAAPEPRGAGPAATGSSSQGEGSFVSSGGGGDGGGASGGAAAAPEAAAGGSAGGGAAASSGVAAGGGVAASGGAAAGAVAGPVGVAAAVAAYAAGKTVEAARATVEGAQDAADWLAEFHEEFPDEPDRAHEYTQEGR